MTEKLRQIVEWQILEFIKRLSELGKMSEEHAQEIAKHTLAVLKPNMTIEELFKGIFLLDDGFPELAFIVLPMAKKYKEKIENPGLEYVRNLIHQTHYDEAIQLAQKLINYDVKIKFVAKGVPDGHTIQQTNQ